MKKIFFLLLVTLSLYGSCLAQNITSGYKTAVGVKAFPGAFTIKSFSKPNTALEGLAYAWQDGVRFTGLYEFYKDLSITPGLKWYVGPGVHIGFWNDSWKKANPGNNTGAAIGIDGIIGLDYKFTGAPINLSLDWQPSFNFIGYNYFEGGWGGIAVRYTF